MADQKKQTHGDLTLFPEMDPNSAILSADEIRRFVVNGNLIVDNTFDERCLQATSYDVRIGKKGIIGGQGAVVNLVQQQLIIEPGSYAGVVSFEKMKLPTRVLAQIGSKRKMSYDGLILLTGSVVDPGYEGHLLFGLYNASTKRVVLPAQTKICNLTFILLSSEQKPVPADTNLLTGDLPSDFVNKMANMDVLPWSEISSEVKHIQKLAKDILDLRQRYDDVLEPIKQLTGHIERVTSDVRSLTQDLKGLASKVDKLDDATAENARQLSEAIHGVKLLTSQVVDVKQVTNTHEQYIGNIRTKVARFSVILTIAGSIFLLILGALINKYLGTPRDAQPSQPTQRQSQSSTPDSPAATPPSAQP